MKFLRNEQFVIRSVAGARQVSLLLAASLLSVSAFAACSDNGTNNDASNAGAGASDDGGDSSGGKGNGKGGAGGKGNGKGGAGGKGNGKGGDTSDAGSDSAGSDSAGASGAAGAEAGDPASAELTRDFIGSQVGGLANLTVPPDDQSIPVPPDDPTRPGRYKTTAAKTFLGKLLFHDPVRTARVNINVGQPLDLSPTTAFGGTINASDPNVQAVRDATVQTGSCGSCHIGEAAGKAGQLLNFNVGGEGRGYTDEKGTFFPRRRAMASLTKQRTQPLFPGDALVDVLPTLTDIFSLKGQRIVTTPALFYHNNDPVPADFSLLMTGRLDQLDSVGRESPALVGFAFNNRLLFGGFGGEPQTTAGALNPLSDPAGENMTLLLLDAHRMLNFQSAELLKIPAFVQAFREAFPEEAKESDTKSDPTILINDQTEFRAQATFLRTVVTRNTPFDRFIAGKDDALTASQLRGARLFFTKPQNGGAGCFSCHSGPMLNKQPNDPDVAGIGQFVEENFANVGIGDHPVQALNALARGHATAYHAEDTGRSEITGKASDAFKFRSLTLRQLRDGRTFFHNGGLTKVRDVVSYFNAGVPQDPTAGSAATIDPRFTYPRGPSKEPGLGLTEGQVDDVTDFLENGLYDEAFVSTLQPTAADLNYSKNHPTLAKAGATDGLMLSGRAIDDNDPLARRDQGLEFLDVTAQATVVLSSTSGNQDTWLITNTGNSVIDTHLLVVVSGLPSSITVDASSKTTGNAALGGTSSGMSPGLPYYRIFLPEGVLNPGQSISRTVVRTGGGSGASYTLKLLSGQGKP